MQALSSVQLRHGAIPLACARSTVAIVSSSARKPTLLLHFRHVSFSKNSVLPHASQRKVRIGGPGKWVAVQDVCHERAGRAVPLRLGLYSADNNSEPKRPDMARVGCIKLSWVLLVALAQSALAQQGAPDGEWRTYGGDLGHTRYAPLEQIDASNFNRLEIAWRFKTDSLGPNREFNFQSTPLMVDGVVYSTAGSRRAVVALDAGNGELLWIHRLDEGERGQVAPRQLSGRGLAYWENGDDKRIVYVTPGYQMIALDARTGDRVASFGDDGIVDLKQNIDQNLDPLDSEIGLHATPIVAKNVIIVGAAHPTGANPTSARATKGYVRGFDARTGERLWIFHTVPMRGEFGTESWLRDSNEYTGNTGVWAQISVDPELETVYLPVEESTGDYTGIDRPGDNLFSETLLAVDLNTGERKWHFQLVHHGIWDFDIPCCADPVRRRRRRPHREGRRAADEAGVPVRVRSRDGPAAVADRGAARAEGRRARRVVLADAADPDEAAGLRPPRHHRERPHRLHAGAAPRGARDRRVAQDGAAVHAARRQQHQRPARHADGAEPGRRHELAGRLVRSRDGHSLRRVGHDGRQQGRRAAVSRPVRDGVHRGQRRDGAAHDGRLGLGRRRRPQRVPAERSAAC